MGMGADIGVWDGFCWVHPGDIFLSEVEEQEDG